MRGILLAVAASALVLGCGGGPAAPAATPTPTSTPAPTPTPTPDLFAQLAPQLVGHYTGTWNNKTFGSGGPISADVTVDVPTHTVNIGNLTLGGNVFGAPAPPPESIALKPSGQGTLTGRSNTFGDLTASAGATGVTLKGVNVPGGRVASFDATLVPAGAGLAATYNVQLKDGTTATGTITLTKS